MSVTLRPFGALDGAEVRQARLESAVASVAILSYGCVVQDWRVGDVPVVLGFDAFDPYPEHSRSFGIIAGRVANRTAFGRFTLDGVERQLTTNHGPHHLHGGAVGLGRRLWGMEADQAATALRLTYHSPHGEEGYPGAVDFTVDIRLDGATLHFDMRAAPDRPTPVNLAQHNYYNLGGGGDVLDHTVWIDATGYTPVDADLIPTGTIEPTRGGAYDFLTPRPMIGPGGAPTPIDLNLVLDTRRDPKTPAAVVACPRTDLRLSLWTAEPGLQLFNAPEMQIAVPGLGGRTYGRYGGLCLEAQHFPNSLNVPAWPGILATPEAPYRQSLAVEIA